MKSTNKYISNIERIEFMITYACTSKCKHCSLGEVYTTEHINTEKGAKLIKDVASNYEVASIMTFGGEPLLYSDTTIALHKVAKECGIPKRQVITNGCFSRDESQINAVAKKLADNANNILLSVDTFHSEFLPLEWQRIFAKALCDIGFDGLSLHPAWLIERNNANKYNLETEQCLAYFSDLKLRVTSGNNIFPAGNAKKYLSEYFPKKRFDMSFKCGLDELHGISVNPNGDIIVCAFSIGNIYNDSILDILANYNPYSNPMMSALLNHGISGLYEFSKEYGLNIDLTDYFSPCDMCRDIVIRLMSNRYKDLP